MTPFPEIDPEKLKRMDQPPEGRLVSRNNFAAPVDPTGSLADFIDGLPPILKTADLIELGRAINRAKEKGGTVIWMVGAHLIKVGLSPILIDLMRKGYVSCLALNGAGMIHDYEIAAWGRTSEDVAAKLDDGSFGMDSSTADPVNRMAVEARDKGIGLGEAAGQIIRENTSHADLSLLAAATEAGIPATVHVGIGTDIVHMHPSCDGAALGESSLRDFRILAAAVARLEVNGVVINVGSAVVLPEVFLKALSAARNLGHEANGFTAANLDMVTHYRPATNVLQRPTQSGGKAINITGHHEIMIPLLAGAILNGGKQV
jgi:deoxyhypusine synthase